LSVSAGAAPLTGLVAVVGFEAALLGELGLAKPDGPRWPGVITTRRPVGDPAFALQVLPEVAQVKGATPEALVEGGVGVLAARVAAHAGPVLVHAYVPDAAAYRTIEGQAAKLGRAVVERLRAEGAAQVKLGNPAGPNTTGFGPQTLLVQLALVGRTSLLVSAAQPKQLGMGGLDLAPWPAGGAPVREDRTAPSRAYRKLVEGFAWLGRAPSEGQSCVDLGGAPGGWAYTALSRGATVTAVDRSPLAPPAAGHPGLTMVLGNAFTFRPPAPVDWLLCDVICAPARTIELCDEWMAAGLCQSLVATLKFKGDADYPAIAAARTRLARHRWPFLRIKHLRNHNNEAVILATRAA
jgi:23S rRNA (cytidine2498-2'-O)-methyltransferase